MERLIEKARLFAAINTRPSFYGIREDDLVCHAKPGECRFNPEYYKSSGLRDAKSWSLPIASSDCNKKCPYLAQRERELVDKL